MAKNNINKLLLIIITSSIIFRMIILIKPINELLLLFSDDAFYYFVTVDKFINGNEIAFNAGIPTNGFHPLYFICLVPIFSIFSNISINAPLYVSLIMLNLFDIGTGINLFKICKEKFNTVSGYIAILIWNFNPFIILTTNLGLEIPISLFFISLLLLKMQKFDLKNLTQKQSIEISILLGLIILSRLDGIFILMGVLFSIFVRKTEFYKHKFKNINVKNIKNIVLEKNFLVLLIFPVILMGIWILWSYLSVGLVYPISTQKKYDGLFSSSHFNDMKNSIKLILVFSQNSVVFPFIFSP